MQSDQINFDEASKAWNANKKKIRGFYYYKCCYRHSNGKRCTNTIDKPSNQYVSENEATKKNTSNQFCYQHRNRLYIPSIHTWT